jgi:adenine/guanine phosphoribosyltransferase-like PRPP-binding protein
LPFLHECITHVATVDAGGFPLGGGIAYRLKAGAVLIRKGPPIVCMA